MFIFRWIRGLLVLIGIGTVIYWGLQYFNSDSDARKKVEEITKSQIVQEGIKDVKTWAGEAVKGIGDKISDEPDKTDDQDRKELDDLIKNELNSKKTETKKQEAKK